MSFGILLVQLVFILLPRARSVSVSALHVRQTFPSFTSIFHQRMTQIIYHLESAHTLTTCVANFHFCYRCYPFRCRLISSEYHRYSFDYLVPTQCPSVRSMLGRLSHRSPVSFIKEWLKSFITWKVPTCWLPCVANLYFCFRYYPFRCRLVSSRYHRYAFDYPVPTQCPSVRSMSGRLPHRSPVSFIRECAKLFSTQGVQGSISDLSA